MRFRFITVLHYLKLFKLDIQIPLGAGIVSNQEDLMEGILDYRSRLALHTLGVHSIDEFQKQTFYIFDGVFPDGVDEVEINKYGTQLTFAFLRQIQWVTDKLWFVRDNSVYIRDGFLFVYTRDLEDGCSFKASLSTINVYSSMKLEDSVFSEEEIMDCAKGMPVYSFDYVRASERGFREATQYQYFKDAHLSRKEYSWIYIRLARSSSSAPVKALMYITAMEALVSTSTVELSHQVAERIAVLLGDDLTECVSIYTEVKKGYGFRSKAAHGESIKGTEEGIAKLLVSLDEYLRRLMVFDSPYDLNPEEMNIFFMRRLLSKDSKYCPDKV